MQIELFIRRLNKLSHSNPDFIFNLDNKLTAFDIIKTEERLELKFPKKVFEFYNHINGLVTENHSMKIIALNELTIENETIHFATFNKNIKVCFNIEKLNNANEWTIYNKETGYEITKTISSFWSNKIWQWIENEKKIWEDDWWL